MAVKTPKNKGNKAPVKTSVSMFLLNQPKEETTKTETKTNKRTRARKKPTKTPKKKTPVKKEPDYNEIPNISPPTETKVSDMIKNLYIDNVKEIRKIGGKQFITQYKREESNSNLDVIEGIIKQYDDFFEKCLIPFIENNPEHEPYFEQYLDSLKIE